MRIGCGLSGVLNRRGWADEARWLASKREPPLPPRAT